MTMVVGASGPVVNSPYVNKGITTLATNINLILMWKTLKINIINSTNISRLFKTLQT